MMPARLGAPTQVETVGEASSGERAHSRAVGNAHEWRKHKVELRFHGAALQSAVVANFAGKPVIYVPYADRRDADFMRSISGPQKGSVRIRSKRAARPVREAGADPRARQLIVEAIKARHPGRRVCDEYVESMAILLPAQGAADKGRPARAAETPQQAALRAMGRQADGTSGLHPTVTAALEGHRCTAEGFQPCTHLRAMLAAFGQAADEAAVERVRRSVTEGGASSGAVQRSAARYAAMQEAAVRQMAARRLLQPRPQERIRRERRPKGATRAYKASSRPSPQRPQGGALD
uniref:Uncharacterized protein n=1 Tax=Haptolina ericina TaxID=156174 RepID=A0A7S3BSB3_9EUKA|mmetsp:Transcript_66277/g.147933  ORF Transcript_66277/g.147933 Transcript_66277/m.147933 type:complete len:292 (+) Transcript_66277:572-1447(+)